MKKINQAFIIVVLYAVNMGFAQQAGAQQSITFEGSAESKYNGQFVHIYNNALREKHDSVRIVNGHFAFKRPFTVPTRYMFYSSYELKTNHGYAPFGILIDRPSAIKINADMAKLVKTKVSGSSSQVIYNQFTEKLAPAEKHIWDQLYSKYSKAYVDSNNVDTSTQKYKSLVRDYNDLNRIYNQTLINELATLIRKNPGSYASIYLLDINIRNFSLQKQEELYGLLNSKLKSGMENDNIVNIMGGMKKSALGNTVEEFSLQGINGNQMNFYSLRGKYILIDFWGSWCAPCHVAFNDLRELYKSYHDKGFEILGIATEQDRNAWLKDIEKEKLPWIQMIDQEGNQSISNKLFAVTKYPTTVLIDPSGKIIGRDLSRREINEILSKL
jgi:thiol-disulfide isomerase/thioredoxin